MQVKAGPLLSKINYPADLKQYGESDLEQISQELRQYIIDVVSVNGGHFGSSLGVVELTVALHYALNTPYDKLVWDVGHQAYGHKILTGRRELFIPIEFIKALAVFQRFQKVNMTPLVSATLLRQFLPL